MRYLTFALTKGRLAHRTLDMLEKLGITCDEMKDKDSRKLIFTNEKLKLKFFLHLCRVRRRGYRCGRKGHSHRGRTQGSRSTGSGLREMQNVRLWL